MSPRSSFDTAAFAVLFLTLSPAHTSVGASFSQPPDPTYGCPAPALPYDGIAFDDREHQLWYRRFWTGSCGGLSFFSFCSSGRPYWTDSIEEMLGKVSPDRRNELRIKACTVGKVVGHEWSRDNSTRRIDTQLLGEWYDLLEVSRDPFATLNAIERQANERLWSVRR